MRKVFAPEYVPAQEVEHFLLHGIARLEGGRPLPMPEQPEAFAAALETVRATL